MWLDELVAAAQAKVGDRERESLWARGVSDAQIDAFQLGYLNKVLPPLDYPKDFLEWSWSGRRLDDVYVLPMTNILGQVKGIQTRHVDRDRKGYSIYVAAKEEPILFGFGQAAPHIWRTRSVWLVEGGFDLFPIQRVFPNVIPTMTARLPQQLATTLKRLADELWLGYDIDKAGFDGTVKIQHSFERDFRVHSVTWPRVKKLDGNGYIKDPSDLWEAWGDELFGTYLKKLDNFGVDSPSKGNLKRHNGVGQWVKNTAQRKR